MKTSLQLHDRSFDLVLLSNWEDQIIYDPNEADTPIVPDTTEHTHETVTAPINQVLEDGSWTRSIIWDAETPFRDFTQLEVDIEDENNEEKFAGKLYSISLFSQRD